MIPVKICGITSVEDAQLVIRAGASAIGFIFYEASPRYISPAIAEHISLSISSNIQKVGVFVNADLDTIHDIAGEVGLDLVQLHGNETPGFCEQVIYPVIKAFRVGDSFTINDLEGYNVHAFLFDTYRQKAIGGTGETFNWNLVKYLETSPPLIAAGGLTPQNIPDCIHQIKPDAIDVNSGVESQPGKKDPVKIKQLFDVLSDTGDYMNVFDVS